MLRFIKADRVSDVDSAKRILSKYLNRESLLALDSFNWRATIVDVETKDNNIAIKFIWRYDGTDSEFDEIRDDIDELQKHVGKASWFKVGSDSFFGLLSKVTTFPDGAKIENYLDSPFALSFTFTEEDQDWQGRPMSSIHEAGKKSSAIILIPVPSNIAAMLPISKENEYDPHITVAYMPEGGDSEDFILAEAKKAAAEIGTFSVRIDGSTTFPTPQDDGTYPLVALVKSTKLMDYHDTFVDSCEFQRPGLVDTTFALKNYRPHMTLSYSHSPHAKRPVSSVVWTVDKMVLSLDKGDREIDIPLSRGSMKKADTAPYLQVGEAKIPIVIISNDKGELRLRVKDSSQLELVGELEGQQATLVTKTGDNKIDIMEVRKSGSDGFQMFYRSLITYLSKESRCTLAYVRDIAINRGFSVVADKVNRLLDFSEENEEDDGEDKEALGPGYPGTDPSIVTYVKAPQTQLIKDEEPKFSRDLPLHERLVANKAY